MSSKPLFEIQPGNFSLNVSGVAGFFGGDEAISAIQTIHHYKYRKWMGWYNSPGSWNVGKRFGRLAKSRFWDGLFPGPDEEPAKCFELDGKQGPKYIASRSGSVLEHTGHLAYLIMQISKEEVGCQVKGRITKRNKVTIIKIQLIFSAKKEGPSKESEGPPEEGEGSREEGKGSMEESEGSVEEDEEPVEKEEELPNGEGEPPNGEGEPPNGEEEPPNGEEEPPNGKGEPPNGEGETPNREGEPPNREGEPPNGEGETPNREGEPPNGEEEPPKKEEMLKGKEGPPKKTQPPNGEQVREIRPRSGRHALFAIIPMAISITTCILCGCMWDWFCSSMILLGIVSNGIFSVVIGSARLKLQGVNSAPTAPPGDGMLMDGDDIVLLFGKEEDIATITRGKFILEYDSWVRWKSRKEKRKRSVPGDGIKDRNSEAENGQSDSRPEVAAPQKQTATPQKQTAMPEKQIPTLTKGEEPVRDEYTAIGLCSLLLVIQLFVQLLLIPQGKFGGQIMFLISFVFSWAYNLYLSSIDNEYIQEQLILNEFHLKEKHRRTYVFGTRTTAAVFACLMLQPPGVFAKSKWKRLGFEPEDIIRNFMPNNTPVWIAWREKVLEVMKKRDGSRDTCHDLLKMNSSDEETFERADRELLDQLLEDARTAYDQAMDEQEWLRDDENNGNDSIQT